MAFVDDSGSVDPRTYQPVPYGDGAAGSAVTTGRSPGVHFTLLGWIVGLAGLYALNKTKDGHAIIFYVLILIAVLLFVSNYKRIVPKLGYVVKGGVSA